jgi:hypothetical protein
MFLYIFSQSCFSKSENDMKYVVTLQVFYLDVTYVVVAIHIYCKLMFQMFHLFQTYAATTVSCCKCFH